MTRKRTRNSLGMIKVRFFIKGMKTYMGKPSGNPYHRSEPEIIAPYKYKPNRYLILGAWAYFPDDTTELEAKAELERFIANWFAEIAKNWKIHASSVECVVAERGLPITMYGFQSAVWDKVEKGEMAESEGKELFKHSFDVKPKFQKMPYNAWKEAVWQIICDKAEKRSTSR